MSPRVIGWSRELAAGGEGAADGAGALAELHDAKNNNPTAIAIEVILLAERRPTIRSAMFILSTPNRLSSRLRPSRLKPSPLSVEVAEPGGV